MNKEKLNELLDNIYELEGLVHLALTRDDCPDALPGLICRKAKSLSAIAGSLSPREETAETAAAPAEAAPAPEYDADSARQLQPEEISVSESVPETIPESVPETSPVSDDDYSIPEEPVRRQAPAEPRGRLVFTVNDRYRFKRDLFSNSDAEFNTTLALVASMDSYDEAEDYFLGELQWSQQREEVTDFLEIIKNYFK